MSAWQSCIGLVAIQVCLQKYIVLHETSSIIEMTLYVLYVVNELQIL